MVMLKISHRLTFTERVLCDRCYFSRQLCEAGTMIPSLRVRNWCLERLSHFVQGDTELGEESRHLDPGLLIIAMTVLY